MTREIFCFFGLFYDNTPTTEIYTLSLHDALPIFRNGIPLAVHGLDHGVPLEVSLQAGHFRHDTIRSEEHTSELQSHHDLVCRLLLEKKKKNNDRCFLNRQYYISKDQKTDH